jgi:hypothetical protein
MQIIPVILLVSVLATALSCSSSPTSPSAAIAGTYVLATVNGQSVPAIVSGSGDTTVVVTDTLVLTAHLIYTRHMVDTLRAQGSAPVLYSHMSAGTFADTGTSITFTEGVTHISETGTINNGVITITTEQSGFAVGDTPAQFSVTGVFNKQ